MVALKCVECGPSGGGDNHHGGARRFIYRHKVPVPSGFRQSYRWSELRSIAERVSERFNLKF